MTFPPIPLVSKMGIMLINRIEQLSKSLTSNINCYQKPSLLIKFIKGLVKTVYEAWVLCPFLNILNIPMNFLFIILMLQHVFFFCIYQKLLNFSSLFTVKLILRNLYPLVPSLRWQGWFYFILFPLSFSFFLFVSFCFFHHLHVQKILVKFYIYLSHRLTSYGS